jgi:nucleotide-binding universal stress UspA family protein
MSPTAPVVVVGVDGSHESVEALAWAIHYAQCANGTVRAVAAWAQPVQYGYYGTFGTAMAYREPPMTDLRDLAATTLAAVINEAAGDEPPVAIDQQVVEGHPASVLVEQSKSGDLLVVGARGRGAFTGLVLGSVSNHCVHNAECPVVVIRRGTV